MEINLQLECTIREMFLSVNACQIQTLGMKKGNRFGVKIVSLNRMGAYFEVNGF